jgi:hypothetical protein
MKLDIALICPSDMRVGLQARRFCLDNKAVISGVAGALAVFVTLRLVDVLGRTGSAAAQHQAATVFNASATAAGGGRLP